VLGSITRLGRQVWEIGLGCEVRVPVREEVWAVVSFDVAALSFFTSSAIRAVVGTPCILNVVACSAAI